MTSVLGRAVAIGVFDGVHLGHRRILRLTARDAKKLKSRATALTFDPHPANVLSGKAKVPMLFSLAHRLRHIAECGIADTHVLRFTRAFAKTTAAFFVENILVKKLRARSVTVGEGFRFGREAKGDTEFLRREGKRLGFRVRIVKPVRVGGKTVSSTRIRQFIEKGNLRAAAELSGRPVTLFGTVIHGKGRGRRLGFPTLNLHIDHETLPPAGVYAVRASVQGKIYPAALHLGPRPTFHEKRPTAEVHLIDAHVSSYGRDVEIYFVRRLRSIIAFKSADALKRQIAQDLRQIRRFTRKWAKNTNKGREATP